MANIAGRQAESVLELLVEVMPYLRSGLGAKSARATAQLLYQCLALDAAAVVSTERILAFVGAGSDHHLVGSPTLTKLTHTALAGHSATITRHPGEIGCPVENCPLSAAIIAPLWVGERVVGALKLYHTGDRTFTEEDETVASGLARVFNVYLEVAELDVRASLVREAELGALRAQISPHFLFNTLTTIAALTRSDAARAHDLIIDFADFFRRTLGKHGEIVTLRQELDQVERYLRFETARFGSRLRVVYDIDEAALDADVPVLSIQPLVENSIAHGIAAVDFHITVTIAARCEGREATIVVVDDGIGIAPERMAQILEPGVGDGLGIGLHNVDRRLRMLFGPQSGLLISSPPGSGTTVSFRVPFKRQLS